MIVAGRWQTVPPPRNNATPSAEPNTICQLRASRYRSGRGDRSLVDDHCRRSTVHAPLCENMTSPTKPEIGYITYCIVVSGGQRHGHV